VLDGRGLLIKRRNADTYHDRGELLTARQFRECLIELWDYHTELIHLARKTKARALADEEEEEEDEADEAIARHDAGMFLVTSGISPATPTSPAYLDKFLKEQIQVGKEWEGRAADVRAEFTRRITRFLAVYGKKQSERPVDRLIRKLALLKMAAEDAVMGVAVSGANGGEDFDLHLRAWGR